VDYVVIFYILEHDFQSQTFQPEIALV